MATFEASKNLGKNNGGQMNEVNSVERRNNKKSPIKIQEGKKQSPKQNVEEQLHTDEKAQQKDAEVRLEDIRSYIAALQKMKYKPEKQQEKTKVKAKEKAKEENEVNFDFSVIKNAPRKAKQGGKTYPEQKIEIVPDSAGYNWHMWKFKETEHAIEEIAQKYNCNQS
ncbi:S-layer y domain protein [Reticulomyxa filosa]|uniref:S-layer y domain protein n=1 Tax=Reticulomyxa filosa TaxID=46433 RepID=X6P9N0_RETFI|nr:S-layer y domain protein [Reticulomyxa filosa]|eukprot:ETO34342.1 S-layer y domain protein [Reticulomyxa filosa]